MLSSNKVIFEKNVGPYQNIIPKAGFKDFLTFDPKVNDKKR